MRYLLWLRYAAAYALWALSTVASYTIVDLARQAVFAAAIVLSGANSYVVRFVDRSLVVVMGMIWLAVVVWMESAFRQAAAQRLLLRRAFTVLFALSLALLCALLVFARYSRDAQTPYYVAIRDGAIAGMLTGAGVLIYLTLRGRRARPRIEPFPDL
jgi:FtsH-binding integral membrane protein